MAAEAALVAEELGKIVSAQQIFVLRKAIYRLTAHSTNPHAVLCAHLPLRSARSALRQSIWDTYAGKFVPVAICTQCAETKYLLWMEAQVDFAKLRSARGALRQRPCRLCSQAYR